MDACWYALESMTTPTILIIGGKDKGNDYNQIKDLVKQKCAGIVYLGETTRSYTIILTSWVFLYVTPIA